jgi:hypothetical protein
VKATFTDGKFQTAKHWLKLEQQSAALCRVMTQRTVTEEDVWPLPDPFRVLYVYVEDLRRGRPAEVIVFSTTARIDTKAFNWDDVQKRLRSGPADLPLGDDSYIQVQATPNALVRVLRRSGPPLQFFVGEPARGAVQLSICEARAGAVR